MVPLTFMNGFDYAMTIETAVSNPLIIQDNWSISEWMAANIISMVLIWINS